MDLIRYPLQGDINRTLAQAAGVNRDDCPVETGNHWMDNCRSSLLSMISKDLCERHDAIDKCLGTITCDLLDISKLQKKVYSDGRKYLDCTA